MRTLDIVPARAADAAEILVLQRCCWVSEAIANESLDIPPLHETLDDVRGWIGDAWVVRDAGRLIGAVRTSLNDRVWSIGRLMVAPDRQGEGLGRRLLQHGEDCAPGAAQVFELFTGAGSTNNIALYQRAGYHLIDPPQVPGMVFLRKQRV